MEIRKIECRALAVIGQQSLLAEVQLGADQEGVLRQGAGRMKVVAGGATTCGVGPIASAADVAVKSPSKPQPFIESYNWTKFYIYADKFRQSAHA